MRNIEIDGKKLYGVTKVVKEIKFGDPSDKVVRIKKKEKGVYVSLIDKSSLQTGELSINSQVLLDPLNYNDYDLMQTKWKPTYEGVRRLLIEFIFNWYFSDAGIEDNILRKLKFITIMEAALIGTNLQNHKRMQHLRDCESKMLFMNERSHTIKDV